MVKRKRVHYTVYDMEFPKLCKCLCNENNIVTKDNITDVVDDVTCQNCLKLLNNHKERIEDARQEKMIIKNIKINIGEKVFKKEYSATSIEFDGVETELLVLVDIMNYLQSLGNNIFAGAIIHDNKLRDKLKELDVIEFSSHGGHNHQGKNYDKFVKIVNKSIKEYENGFDSKTQSK